MPIVASNAQQAWVRVPAKRKQPKVEKPDTLLGPLSYFSCRPDISNDLSRTSKQLIIPNYSHETSPKKKGRAISAPQRRFEEYDEISADEEAYMHERRVRNVPQRSAQARRYPSYSRTRPSGPKAYPDEVQRSSPAASRQYRDLTPNRAHYSSSKTISSSWANATKALDLS